jgi:hypothetical protein
MSWDEQTRIIFRRDGAVALTVALVACVGIYVGHGWFHDRLLPWLGIGAALGDAIGGFAIILIAYIGQRISSLLLFRDIALGSIRKSQQLQQFNREIQTELCELDRLALKNAISA